METLPEVACILVLPHGTMKLIATPEDLAFRVPRGLDSWAIGVEYQGLIQAPLFDYERVVIYRSTERFPWRASDDLDLDANLDARLPGIRHYLYLGPGWESRAVDLYWGLIRKSIALHREQNPMLAMVYESALAGSK